MELKENYYVRSCEYGIGQVQERCNCSMCQARGYLDPTIKFKRHTEYIMSLDDETLFAKNQKEYVIDLIEVGDYVNGYKVIKHQFFTNEKPVKAIQTINENDEVCYSSLNSQRLLNDDIKSIVTKEQFESVSYHLGKED